MWADARGSDDAMTSPPPPRCKARPRGAAHAADHNTALPLDSFAGVVPENADALAKAHAQLTLSFPLSRPATSSRCT